MPFARLVPVLATAALFAGLLVACQQAAPAPATGAGTGGGPAAATVTYRDTAVAPTSVQIRAGQAVTWVNADGFAHTVTSGVPSARGTAFEQRNLSGGTSATITFAQAGTFEFFCEFHSTMRGRVVVQ